MTRTTNRSFTLGICFVVVCNHLFAICGCENVAEVAGDDYYDRQLAFVTGGRQVVNVVEPLDFVRQIVACSNRLNCETFCQRAAAGAPGNVARLAQLLAYYDELVDVPASSQLHSATTAIKLAAAKDCARCAIHFADCNSKYSFDLVKHYSGLRHNCPSSFNEVQHLPNSRGPDDMQKPMDDFDLPLANEDFIEEETTDSPFFKEVRDPFYEIWLQHRRRLN